MHILLFRANLIVDIHGKIVVNWMISLIIYAAICAVLVFFLIGFVGFAILGALSIIFPIIGGVKANQGEVWEYPLSFKLIKSGNGKGANGRGQV